jgi:hypothetical protein
LQKVFSGRMVLPQEIDLGFWAVRYYGIFMGRVGVMHQAALF